MGLGKTLLLGFIAGASWMAVRRERQRLGFLQGTALALLEARDPDAASVELLRRASRRFNAGCAELTLIADTGTQAAFRTTLRDMDPVDVMRSVGAEVVGVAVIVDRGARAAVEAAGLEYRSAYTLADLGLS